MSLARCQLCSGAARVRILDGYSNARPVIRELCLSCAASSPQFAGDWVAAKRRTGIPTLIGLAGLVLGLMAALADVVVPESNVGFGMFQQGGVALGALMVLTGALIRVDLVVLGGAFIFVAALTADWFGPTRGAGLGWKQQTLIAVSLLMIVCGLIGRYRWTLTTLWRRLAGHSSGVANARPER